MLSPFFLSSSLHDKVDTSDVGLGPNLSSQAGLGFNLTGSLLCSQQIMLVWPVCNIYCKTKFIFGLRNIITDLNGNTIFANNF